VQSDLKRSEEEATMIHLNIPSLYLPGASGEYQESARWNSRCPVHARIWAPCHGGLLGKWRYSSTYSWPRH